MRRRFWKVTRAISNVHRQHISWYQVRILHTGIEICNIIVSPCAPAVDLRWRTKKAHYKLADQHAFVLRHRRAGKFDDALLSEQSTFQWLCRWTSADTELSGSSWVMSPWTMCTWLCFSGWGEESRLYHAQMLQSHQSYARGTDLKEHNRYVLKRFHSCNLLLTHRALLSYYYSNDLILVPSEFFRARGRTPFPLPHLVGVFGIPSWGWITNCRCAYLTFPYYVSFRTPTSAD